MSKHFISRAAINATDALTQALLVWENRPEGEGTFDLHGISELVDIINKTSLHLASTARMVQHNRTWLKRTERKA